MIFMIAKIMLNDKEYWSYIFFICKCDYQTKAIAYNLNEEKFEFLSAFKNKYTSERIIYLFDYKEENLVKKDFIKINDYELNDCLGYEWLINNEEIIKDIINNKEIDSMYHKIAKELNESIDIFKWHEITNKDAADELMDIAGAFHDSYIRDVKAIFPRPHEPETPTTFQMAFEMYGNHFDILLEFEDEITLNYTFSTYLNDVYLSSIVFFEGFIYWVDGGDDLLPIDLKDNPYIKSKKLRWKIIPKLDK